MGCFYDADAHIISFTLNGEDMGVAFSGVPPEDGFGPALSMVKGQQCKINFGEVPMR